MGLLLLLIFIGIPVLEIAVFIQLGGAIGLWPTLGAIFLTAIIGTWAIRMQGLAILFKAQEVMQRGEMPLKEVFDGLCLVLAGALLLTPGFVTDGVGFLLFLPPVRALLRRSAAGFLAKRGGIHVWGSHNRPGGGDGGGVIIDGDFEKVRPEDTETPPNRHLPGGDNQ
ncbi:MAG: FxsA family protein [Rhodospirillales bacterium]|nr:FxsA family protein [Rhodospirillales bacterium]